jgi:hypothetical protein
MHRYECGNCNLVSDPYALRRNAEAYGHDHRVKRHDGMHPLNEAILTSAGRMPQPGEWRAFLIVGILIAAGLISKLL